MTDNKEQIDNEIPIEIIKKKKPNYFLDFILIFSILFIIGLAATPSTHSHPERKATTTIWNLRDLRMAMRMYKLKSGDYPSPDLNELYTVHFNDGGVPKPILEDGVMPPEMMSSFDYNNPENRKVVNKVDNTGGWVYDPLTAKIRVNWNKEIKEKWDYHEEFYGQNPYQDW